MKRLVLVVMVAAVAVAFSGCKKKEPTLQDKINKASATAEKATKDATKQADKAAGDLQKKLDDTLKK